MNFEDAKCKYHQQLRNAKHRGKEFKLTFEEWCQIWVDSGKWEQRGCKRGQYVMSRKGDVGAYEIGNVFIQLTESNASQGALLQPPWNKGMRKAS